MWAGVELQNNSRLPQWRAGLPTTRHLQTASLLLGGPRPKKVSPGKAEDSSQQSYDDREISDAEGLYLKFKVIYYTFRMCVPELNNFISASASLRCCVHIFLLYCPFSYFISVRNKFALAFRYRYSCSRQLSGLCLKRLQLHIRPDIRPFYNRNATSGRIPDTKKPDYPAGKKIQDGYFKRVM